MRNVVCNSLFCVVSVAASQGADKAAEDKDGIQAADDTTDDDSDDGKRDGDKTATGKKKDVGKKKSKGKKADAVSSVVSP